MNIEQAKRDLPNILVKMPNGKTVTGKVSGRLLPLAQVSVPYDGKIHSHGPKPWIDFNTSWAQIARCATDNSAITFA